MKILMVNKFLYPKGGAETYTIKLGENLKKQGHKVQYFGMEESKNTVFNQYNLYVKKLDLTKNNIKSILNVYKLIYSNEAKNKMKKILNLYKPDLIILNNIEYHLTPSVIVAIGRYKERINKNARVYYVAHDYQLICPSHGLFDYNLNICEKCLGGNYWNCYQTKCLKGSKLKSLIGSIDSIYWHKKKIYRYIDKIICPSQFMKNKLDTLKEFKEKTIVIRNFVDDEIIKGYKKENYIIYFGKLCKDKGLETLLKVVRNLKNIKFVFAGYGPLEQEIEKNENAIWVGFKTGNELKELIAKAKISIYPSEWYENCPFSVIESQMYGTPVIGSNIGGIPELIGVGKSGEVFEAGNSNDLEYKLLKLWNDEKLLEKYSETCKYIEVETIEKYIEKLLKIYEGGNNENY